MHPDAITVTGLLHPADGLGAQISAAHWAAAALVRRRAGFEEASDAAAVDPAIVALRGRVTLRADPSIGRDAAVATVRLADRSEITETVAHCVGSAARPMTDAQLEQKFLLQARTVLDDARARRVLDFCWRIGASADVGREFGALFAV